MKKVIAVIFTLGLAILDAQVDARRLALEQVKTEKTENQLQSNVEGRILDAVRSEDADDEHGKSSTYGNPVTGPVPAVVDYATNNINNNGKTSSANTDDESNSSYKNYGNPSGSSTETHHVYANDCQPKKPC